MANDLALETRRRNQIFGGDDRFDDGLRHTAGNVPDRSENGKTQTCI